MLTTLRFFLVSNRVKWTVPSYLAKTVWSLPIPAFSPARYFCPRCRTIMDPAVTCCPCVALTPKRRPMESRPLFVDPPCFLVAMVRVTVVTRPDEKGDDKDVGTNRRVSSEKDMMMVVMMVPGSRYLYFANMSSTCKREMSDGKPLSIAADTRAVEGVVGSWWSWQGWHHHREQLEQIGCHFLLPFPFSQQS